MLTSEIKIINILFILSYLKLYSVIIGNYAYKIYANILPILIYTLYFLTYIKD